MSTPARPLLAIEKQQSVRRSIKDLHQAFAKHSRQISGLRDTTYWHNSLGIWGHFRVWKRKDGSDRYWNAFGTVPHLLRKNIIVEINPPPKARFRNMQGVLARTNRGTRWLLHKGQMSISGRPDFAATNLSGCTVYRMLSISKPISFVRECQRIRLLSIRESPITIRLGDAVGLGLASTKAHSNLF